MTHEKKINHTSVSEKSFTHLHDHQLFYLVPSFFNTKIKQNDFFRYFLYETKKISMKEIKNEK